MIGPLTFSAVGIYPLTNVSEMEAGAVVMQSRLISGTGLTFGFAMRFGQSDVSNAAAPRCRWINGATNAEVLAATDTTATAAPLVSMVPCKGMQILLVIVANAGAGVLRVELNPVLGANS